MKQENCCAACVTGAMTIRPLREHALATRRFFPRSMNSKGTCTSTFTWKITCCFRVRSTWRRGKGDAGHVRNRKESSGDAGAHLRDYRRAGTPAVLPTGVLYRDRADFHAAPGNVSWCLELDEHQQPSRSRNRLCWLDSGPWSRADLRLDWHLHPWDWLLLDPQTAAQEAFCAVGAVDLLDFVDLGRGAALDNRRLRMAVAVVASRVRSA